MGIHVEKVVSAYAGRLRVWYIAVLVEKVLLAHAGRLRVW